MNAPAPDRLLASAVVPPERRGIARDEVKLLVSDRAAGTHAHASFLDLAGVLRPGDLLVVNDSATMAAALEGRRASGEAIALHVATRIDERLWIVEPRAAVREGEALRLPGGASALLLAPVAAERPRLWYARFTLPATMVEYLARYGAPIRYGYVTARLPLADYQTIFARRAGSAEMPSAARPFSLRVLDALHRRGIEIAAITLHCGVSSFEAPERPSIERFAVPPGTAAAVNRARASGRRVIAVGTTPLRALESAVDGDDVVAASGWTDLVIDPSHHVRTADGLLTGFHPDGATHRWILGAFLDDAALARAYGEAAAHGYLQHEFGDVHLIA